MSRKLLLLMLLALLIGTLNLVSRVEKAKASGTIYIRAGGSVDPPTAPISSIDNVTYTLIGNITSDSDGIVIQRNNMTLDGAGYTIQGSRFSKGVVLTERTNITIRNVNVRNFELGISLDFSFGNYVIGNNITWSSICSISLDHSSNNNIVENNITENYCAIFPGQDTGVNLIVGNNIANNTYGIYGSSNSQIIGNNITMNERDAINGYSGNSIVGNRIIENYGRGISLLSSGNSITENDIERSPYGIHLMSVLGSSPSNNTLSRNQIVDNHYGIRLENSLRNNITANFIARNTVAGVYLFGAHFNNISRNDFANNSNGIRLDGTSYMPHERKDLENRINHNNFVHSPAGFEGMPTSIWDDGYPSGGNYWSEYVDIDEKQGPSQDQPGSDGICDGVYILTSGEFVNADSYPLIAPYSTFEAGTLNETPYNVDVISNSTVSDFHFNPDEGPFLEFNVTGQEGTAGFCRVAISKGLLWAEGGQWGVLVGGVPVTNYTITSDENHSYLYFTYDHSTKTVYVQGTSVIPEFQSILILPLFFTATLIGIKVCRKRLGRTT